MLRDKVNSHNPFFFFSQHLACDKIFHMIFRLFNSVYNFFKNMKLKLKSPFKKKNGKYAQRKGEMKHLSYSELPISIEQISCSL